MDLVVRVDERELHGEVLADERMVRRRLAEGEGEGHRIAFDARLVSLGSPTALRECVTARAVRRVLG